MGNVDLITFISLYNLQSLHQSDMEAFEWEEKDDHTPFWVHMIAGSFAGLSEHLSMLPLDNVKTHCQAGSHLKFHQIVRNIYNAGGLSNFYSGTSVLAMGCIPAHAIYFSIYEQAKNNLDCEGENNHYKFALVGMASALFHDLVMTPTQVLKQRLQLTRSQQNWVHTRDLGLSIMKNQGFIAFYRSFGINFLMSLPFHSSIVFMNEKLKYLFNVKTGDEHFKYYLCGGLAGGIASIPTTPFDVIKTKLNTQNCLNKQCQKQFICEILNRKAAYSKFQTNPAEFGPLKMSYSRKKTEVIKYRNILDTTYIIMKEQGLAGFFNGLKFRMAISSVSSAIAWGTYNVCKSLIYPENSQKF